MTGKRDENAAPLRVLHLTEAERWAGIEAHLGNLIPAQLAAGIDVQLATFFLGPLSEQIRFLGRAPHLVERTFKYDPGVVKRVRELIASLEIDILHTHGYLADIIGSLACRKAGRKIAHVVTQHGRPEPFTGLHGLKMRLNLTFGARAMRKAGRVIAVSQSVREYLMSVGVAEEKIEVLASAISPIEPVEELRAAVREELEIKKDEIAIGFVARLEPVKRVHLLADVSAELEKLGVAYRFVVCGGGPERETLELAIQNRNAGERFQILGHRTDVERLVQAFDVLAISSISEGVPVSLLEAMSAGAVPVCFNVGGLHEAVDDGVDGIFVEDGDTVAMAKAIAGLQSDQNLLRKMSGFARKKVTEKFAPETLVKKLEAVYRKALAG